MARYLLQGTYTPEGARGLLKDGGSKRRAAIAKLVEGLGGRLEACYYALGDTDVYVIVELPDNVAVAAASIVVAAAGAAGLRSTVLLTPEEIDQAVQKTPTYTPPGR
jgi:uncharacterized protein with GYD domain